VSRRNLIGVTVALATAVSAWATPAAPIDPKKVPPGAAAMRTAIPAGKTLPNLAVDGVRLGAGTGDRFAPLGHSPMLGEKVSLICKLDFAGLPPAGWTLAWFVDGVKTCGEGVFTTAPSCEYEWGMGAQAIEVFIDWVGHEAGSHTYRCAVDTHHVVLESSESDNSKEMSFQVKAPLQPISPDLIPVTAPRLGPQFRRLR